MFTPDPAWAGPLTAVAAVALRLYLKGRTTMPENSALADQQLIRDMLWEHRDEVVDFLILHECSLRDLHFALLRMVGLHPDQWIIGALADARDVAES